MRTEFIILVTGSYHWLVPPLLHFYEKYMPVPLTFFSDRPISGCNAIEVFPRDMRIYKEECGKRIKDALLDVRNEIVMFGYMDILPILPVDLRLLEVLAQFMEDHALIARGNLWAEADHVCSAGELVVHGEGYEIRKLPRDDPQIGQIGCTSLLPALWRKDFLLDFIEDRWTFDTIEYPGQRKFERQRKWFSVALLPGLFTSCHLMYTGAPNVARLSTIPDPEDRAFVAQFVPSGYRVE